LHSATINYHFAITLTIKKQRKIKLLFLKYKKDGMRYAITTVPMIFIFILCNQGTAYENMSVQDTIINVYLPL